jgi:hypothetical protein
MSDMQNPSAVCPYCGCDVAHLIPTTNGWQVICNPEIGGCAATGVAGDTEAEALTIWNAGLYTSAGRKVA